MTEVLLIIPPFNYGELSEAGPVYPSIGVLYVAAVLEKEGYEVGIIDMFAEGYQENKLKSFLNDDELKIVGFSCVSATFKICLKMLRLVKKLRPEVKTLVGGPHVTVLTEQAMKNDCIDFGVLGEGDYTSLELVNYLIKGEGVLKNIKGICFKDKDRLVMTDKRPFIKNLDELPFPAYHLLPMDKYRSYGVFDSGRKTASMITSRGCPFKCIYCCSSKLFGGKWRSMSAEKAIEHIKKLHDEFGVEHIYFQDDEFTVDHQRVMDICDWMIENTPDLTWECLTRVSHVNDKLLERMSEAGCQSIMYGIEVGYSSGLKRIKKGITLKQAIDAINLTKEHCMLAKASFIIGFPWESRKEVKQTIDFAVSLDADYSFFTILCPFPTTEVYEQIKEERLFIDNFSFDMYSGMPAPESLVKTRHLSSEELVNLMGYAYKRIYFNPGYIIKRLLSFRHFSELKRNIKAGLSLLRLSIKSMLKK